jgi:flagellar assembly protein FliH
MSTLFSGPSAGRRTFPVEPFRYKEGGMVPLLPHVRNPDPADAATASPGQITLTEEALAERLAAARAEGAAAAEAKMRAELEARADAEAARITTALKDFGDEAKTYYARVEGEVVRLALSIAAKILHREAQVDPMLVAALVQIAIEQLKENSAVHLRVRPEAEAQWRARFENTKQWARVTITPDAALEPGGCLLETELGTANLSLDAQLKEVEQGFFDVLALKPRS